MRGGFIKMMVSIAGCVILLLGGCSDGKEEHPAGFVLTMDMTKDYDDKDPFIEERLFYVEENAEAVSLAVQVKMNGISGLIELADNETGDVFWKDTFENHTDITKECVLDLTKDVEYVMRFTGNGIEYAHIRLFSENSHLKERNKPLHKQ